MQTELFEWDDDKAERNVRVHGVDFQEARTVFEDPFAITIPDDHHSEDEPRSIILGLSLLARVLLVVHTERKDRIRIISARKATPAERFQYESNR
ncbi:MAG: BrnT family toxin [Terracidiphilus sp.]|nr:BrnT family toxin [Terracidiphilus sp.]MDR3799085.1 BrnT family toxin [Terracidiphilus sp.]